MIKYKTSRYNHSITEVEVSRETAQSVFVKSLYGNGERREAKHSDWGDYHDTMESARKHVESSILRKIEDAELSIQLLKKELDIFRSK